jgi:CheY-like chemotaxis protein
MSKKKILVVDDEPGFTHTVKLNLEDTGKFEVRTENKGAAALGAIKDFEPDLILLDIVMPDCDGGEIMHMVKEDSSLKHIPVIFLTAIVKDDEVTSYDGLIGGHPFIAKPVTPEKLIECIEQNLAR